MPVSKVEPAKIDGDVMKPSKLLQSQGTFFCSSLLFLMLLECIWWFSRYLHPHVSSWINMVSVFPVSHYHTMYCSWK